jgi:hypothetical protein
MPVALCIENGIIYEYLEPFKSLFINNIDSFFRLEDLLYTQILEARSTC